MHRWQTLDQTVEQGLRFRINPVQILEHQQQGLFLAFAQQQPFKTIKGVLPARLMQSTYPSSCHSEGLLHCCLAAKRQTPLRSSDRQPMQEPLGSHQLRGR